MSGSTRSVILNRERGRTGISMIAGACTREAVRMIAHGRKKIAVVAGAGPAGLTAALELLRRSDITPIVFEADNQVGGISKTINYRGNRMDLGGHRFFSKSDWVMRWWQEILPVAEGQSEAGKALRISYQGQERDLAPEVFGSASS